jgi:plasmid stabilization system protein ParE
MSLPVVLDADAKADFIRAFDHYESQRPGLGDEFTEEIVATLDRIADHPYQYALVYRDAREALVHRFPFAIYYYIEPARIGVYSVFHTSRDPRNWKSRVPR